MTKVQETQQRMDAIKWLQENDLLKFQLKSLDRLHVGDKQLAAAHFLAGITVSLPKRHVLHLHTVGLSGKGKGHTAESVLMLFPEENAKTLTSFSNKALYYINTAEGFDKKIIYIPEVNVSDESQVALLRVLCDASSETVSPEHWTLDLKRKPIRMTIDGRVSVWFSAETAVEDKQLKNRMLIGNPDESKEQDAKVYDSQLEKLGLLTAPTKREAFDLNQKLTAEILGEDDLDVFIPYSKLIRFDYKNNRRLLPQFISLLKATTKTRMHQRKTITVRGEPTLVATRQDFETASWVWNGISQNIIRQVSQQAIQAYNVLPTEQTTAFDKNQVAAALGWGSDWAYKKLSELHRAGLVNSYKPDRAYVYWRPSRTISDNLGFRVNWRLFNELALKSVIQVISYAQTEPAIDLEYILGSQGESEHTSKSEMPQIDVEKQNNADKLGVRTNPSRPSSICEVCNSDKSAVMKDGRKLCPGCWEKEANLNA